MATTSFYGVEGGGGCFYTKSFFFRELKGEHLQLEGSISLRLEITWRGRGEIQSPRHTDIKTYRLNRPSEEKEKNPPLDMDQFQADCPLDVFSKSVG